MSRKIKFRFWDGQVEQMFYPKDKYDDKYRKQELYDFPHKICNDILSAFHFDYLLPLQYTNVKDKSGVEIYDKDIVENSTGRRFPVHYSDTKAGFVLYSIFQEQEVGILDINVGEEVEVVGNELENPELLNT